VNHAHREYCRASPFSSFSPKAGLKPPHSKRWRDGRAFSNRAKRLDCDAFTAAFDSAWLR
jgi:hypothetical protein